MRLAQSHSAISLRFGSLPICSSCDFHKFIPSTTLSFLTLLVSLMLSRMRHKLSQKLENINENLAADLLSAASVPPPETPTEYMEFLARSWSLSAKELSKALSSSNTTSTNLQKTTVDSLVDEAANTENSVTVKEPECKSLIDEDSPPRSPRGSEETKDLFLLNQALRPELLSNQQLFKNGLYTSILRGKNMGKWPKEQKERKKHEIRTHNAQLHAAVSVAGVAAAVAAITASSVIPSEMSTEQANTPSRIPAAIASAAALVASHCIEIAEDMGADHHQILSMVNSAISARTNGDIMTLTAGAATALRGAAALKARLQNGYGAAAVLAKDDIQDGEKSNLTTLQFVSKGGELLKRTREGALHWKQVSFSINSNFQVIVKLKSKHMAGTFTKKKSFVVSGVYSDVPAWAGREWDNHTAQKAYFGIQITERIIEFECKNKGEKQMWTDGIQHMLNCRINMT